MTNNTISIRKVTKSRVSEIDFDNIPFGKEFTDHMFVADYSNGEWHNFQIRPLEPLQVHPGNLAWHYGQSIFEGMKASKSKDGTPMLFRPEKHIERLNRSAVRMCMPEFPEQVFMDAVNAMVSLESVWIPPSEGSALYLRPLMIATDEAIGVRPSANYKFLIMCLPVGPYYSKPVSLKVEEKYIRAGDGGVGEAKTAGNYAASLYPAKMAKEEGYDQIMWMDSQEFKFVQEVGTMNIFFVIGDKVITPSTTGSILKGITRSSAIDILKSKNIEVEQRNISINEIIEAHKAGELKEVFGTGTAAVVAKVSKIGFRGDDYELTGPTEIGDYIKGTINGLRLGTVEDQWGWTVPARSLENLVTV